MSDKRYAVIFTGQVKPESNEQIVVSNLVLDLGVSQEKVLRMFKMGSVVLKRCATISEAQRLAEKFDQAGAICIIEDRLASDANLNMQGATGESSLMRFINRFIPSSRPPAGTGMRSKR